MTEIQENIELIWNDDKFSLPATIEFHQLCVIKLWMYQMLDQEWGHFSLLWIGDFYNGFKLEKQLHLPYFPKFEIMAIGANILHFLLSRFIW